MPPHRTRTSLIPLLNEFPCLEYLRNPFTDCHNNNWSLDPVSTSSTWNYEQSIAWPLIPQLNFKIQALSHLYHDCLDCSIDEYFQVYKWEYERETEQDYKMPDS